MKDFREIVVRRRLLAVLRQLNRDGFHVHQLTNGMLLIV